MQTYKEDVEEIIYSLQGDIADIKEKKDKYIEKADTEIVLKTRYANVLKEIAKDLPEKRPNIPGVLQTEEIVKETIGELEGDEEVSVERNGEKIVDIQKQ